MLPSRRLLVVLIAAFGPAACGGASRDAAILSDEELFPGEYAEAVDFAREQCPEFARSASTFADGVGGQSTGASLSVEVTEEAQPSIREIASRHGPADSTSEGTHYYGDIGFRTGADGEVEHLVIDCMKR